MIGRLRWTNSSIVNKVKKLVIDTKYHTAAIKKEKVNIAKTIGSRFIEFIKEERRRYGSISYFNYVYTKKKTAKPKN